MKKHKQKPKQEYIKESTFELEGRVIESLPNAMFRVKITDDHIILAHISGKVRKFNIKIIVGDRVTLEMSPYDLTKARLIFRYK